jgi:nucleotide-binding universal stress UspA family protein
MSTVLATLDENTVAEPVLETALRCGQLFGSDVGALHVCRHPGVPHATMASLAERSGVPLRVVSGPVVATLLESLAGPEIVTGVLGARARGEGRDPVGHVAAQILERIAKPVVIVPPDRNVPGRIRRLLVPLEGTEASSRPVTEWLLPRIEEDVELVVVHAFTGVTRPGMLDRPEYDWSLLGDEFLARHFPGATHVELASGPAARRITEASISCQADLVVMSWAQDTSEGRAKTLRAVLRTSSLPVLLLPRTPAEASGPPVAHSVT